MINGLNQPTADQMLHIYIQYAEIVTNKIKYDRQEN